MTTLIIILHLCIDFILGLNILIVLEKSKIDLFVFAKSTAIGMAANTLLVAILNFLGLSVQLSFVIISIIVIGIFLHFMRRGMIVLKKSNHLSIRRFTIWEFALTAIILEKFVWGVLNIYKVPVYFDDTFNHWSGRGNALLNDVNWSWHPDSIYFLGDVFGHLEYPLFASIWRAINNSFLSAPNGVTERFDGLIMWLIIIVTVIAWIQNNTQKRWAGLLGAALISMVPLQAWHIIAGYADIYVQAYLLLSLWSVLNGKYVLAGIFSAGLIWSKNEGFIMYVPALMICLFFFLILSKNLSINEKLKNFLHYNLTWITIIAPWIIFKLYYNVGFTTPSKEGIGYIDGAIEKMSDALFNSPTSSIFWIAVIIASVISLPNVIKRQHLLPLFLTCIVILVMMTFIFTCTGAYVFLENQMTIHRSLMQITPIFVVYIILISLPDQQSLPVTESLSTRHQKQ